MLRSVALGLIGLILTAQAVHSQAWVCARDVSSGFFFDKEANQWQTATFGIGGDAVLFEPLPDGAMIPRSSIEFLDSGGVLYQVRSLTNDVPDTFCAVGFDYRLISSDGSGEFRKLSERGAELRCGDELTLGWTFMFNSSTLKAISVGGTRNYVLSPDSIVFNSSPIAVTGYTCRPQE